MIVIALPSREQWKLTLLSGTPAAGIGLWFLATAFSGATVAPPIELREPAAETRTVAAAIPAPDDRGTILEAIRDHRRTASEAWRQRLADAIYRESVAASMDPLMVASIVAKESSFQSRVVSRAGAVGLMQLRPWVARDVAERREIEWEGLDTLHSPDLNVRLGVLYFKELVERFDGDNHLALTAYNYGPSRVSFQLRNGTYDGSDYAERVMCFYEELVARRDNPSADPDA